MRLILREYLALQKESGELDALLPDLLLGMGIRPVNRAGKGNRQYGVDIPAVGVDPTDGRQKLVLVTAKQGDIDRATWNSGHPADVKPSLDEILTIYLRSHVEPAHQGLPVLVVLATGGDMDENVRLDWVSYVDAHQGTLHRGGVDYEVDFAFWGGDELAALLEDHLLDEYLFPAGVQGTIRRTLALLGDPSFDLAPFEALVRDTLDPARLTDVKKRRRALRFLRLAVRVVYRWAEREGNLRPALLASEYVLLRTWHFIADQGLTRRGRAELPELAQLYETWREVAYAFFEVLRPHCETPHGLFGYSAAEEMEYPIRVYDLLGHLAAAGLDELYLAQLAAAGIGSEATGGGAGQDDSPPPAAAGSGTTGPDLVAADGSAGHHSDDGPPGENLAPDDVATDDVATGEGDAVAGDLRAEDAAPPPTPFEHHLGNARVIANRVVSVISNNPAALTPPFDDNVVEVALVLTLLAATGHERSATAWARGLANTMSFAWDHAKNYVPTYSGTYDDRVDAILGVEPATLPSSTILPLLAEWALVLDAPDLYDSLQASIGETLDHVNIQTWYPTAETGPSLYAGPAMDTGHMRTSTPLPGGMEDFAAQVRHEHSLDEGVPAYSADAFGLPIISVLASRRFRTPLRPSFWRLFFLRDEAQPEEGQDEDLPSDVVPAN